MGLISPQKRCLGFVARVGNNWLASGDHYAPIQTQVPFHFFLLYGPPPTNHGGLRCCLKVSHVGPPMGSTGDDLAIFRPAWVGRQNAFFFLTKRQRFCNNMRQSRNLSTLSKYTIASSPVKDRGRGLRRRSHLHSYLACDPSAACHRHAPFWAPSSHLWHVLFSQGMLMCESADDPACPVTFLVAHQC